MTGTDQKIRTPAARGRSGPVRYELVDKDGRRVATNVSAAHLGIVAGQMWPDQEQDEERTGKGWDVQVAMVDCPVCRHHVPARCPDPKWCDLNIDEADVGVR